MNGVRGKDKPIKATSTAINKRLEDQRHERMLLSINDKLPDLIHDQLQTTRFLNEALAKKRGDLTQRIDKLIVTKKIDGAQAKIWRQVPNVSYASPELDLAIIRYCVGLEKSIEYFASGRSPLPKIIYTADFVAEFSVSVFDFYLRDGYETSYPEIPLKTPVDGISLHKKEFKFLLAGGIYPGSMTIGSVASDMQKLYEATQQSGHDTCLPVFATDREAIFDVLRLQYDALLFDTSGALIAHDLEQVTKEIRQSCSYR